MHYPLYILTGDFAALVEGNLWMYAMSVVENQIFFFLKYAAKVSKQELNIGSHDA